MKKLLLSVVLLATSMGFAQEKEFESPFKKGRFAIGGSLSTSKNESENTSEFEEAIYENESTSYRISPSIGYFIKDNTTIGVSIGYSKNESKQTIDGVENNEYNRKSEYYTLGMYYKKYYKLYHRFYFHVSGDAQYTTIDVENNSDDTYYLSFSLNPGLSWALNKNLAVHIGFDDVLGYRYSSRQIGNNKISNNSLFADLGNSTLSVGFRYFL